MKRYLAVIGICVVAVAGVCVAVIVGCTQTPSVDRGNRLMALAAEEAGAVQSPPERLTRQLNIADLQCDRGQKANASRTLAAARKTIAEAGERLTTPVSMAGCVSISQLGRRIGDASVAAGACDDAIAMLRKVTPAHQRVPYVHGLAYELRQLRGNAASSEFIREAGPWCTGIDDPIDRREALVMFATDLFDCEDYDGGRDMLGQDTDAGWRSDTLLAMARTSFARDSQSKHTFAAERAVTPEATAGSPTPGTWAKAARKTHYAQQLDLDYTRNFRGRELPASQPAQR